MQVHEGIVENRNDPLKLGRCQVRVIGLHTHDKTQLKTEELPWAYPMQSITSAAMSGIGQAPVGVVEGTVVLIVFMDDPDNQQPIIIGSLGGIPQAKAVELYGREDDSVILKDPTGAEVEAPVNTEQAATVDSNKPTPTVITTDIPTVPPPNYRGDTAAAVAGIKALLSACDKVGLTTREQKCAVLACAGGECGWIPQEEGYSYSADGLMSTFKATFAGKPDLAAQYARAPKSGMSRETFFNLVYAPENNGRQLGNTQAGDGGKYYGRGFIQLTGRANYTKYGSKAGVDLINNPSLVNTPLDTAALIAVTYIKDRTSSGVSASDNPGYFYAVKRGIGNDTGNGAATRLEYYEYFYGTKTESSYTEEKSPTAPAPSTSTSSNPGPSTTNPVSIGFQDPNGKYPLKSFINEPDTNRLARGVSRGTVVTIKEANRARSIPIALDGGTYDEPSSAFSAKYPFNHVLETESGHIQEWDDTPGYERTHTYHRKGTFTEVDTNGSEIHHIVGDSYTIIDRNGCIFISGECNLTTEGKINILCQSDANIEVAQDLTMQVGGDFKLGVAKDFTVAVGGTVSMQAGSNMFLQSNSSMHLNASSGLYGSAGGDIHLKASGTWNADGTRIDFNHQTSTNATSLSLTPPAVGSPKNNILPYLVPPMAAGEDTFKLESEDDWNTPEGQKAKAEIDAKYGVQTPENNPAQDEAAPTGGSDENTIVSCQVIYATESFTNDFKLSANFTLGMLIDGGVNGNNKLQNQVGLTKQQIVCNLSQLCANILEPALAILPGGIGGYKKQWQINSGYRSSSNSTSTSDHPTGRACDITLLPYDATKKQRNFDLIQKLEGILPYDQMIMEYRSGGSNWIHLGYRGVNKGDTTGPGGVNRKMAFTMLNDQVYQRDSSGNPKGFILI